MKISMYWLISVWDIQ